MCPPSSSLVLVVYRRSVTIVAILCMIITGCMFAGQHHTTAAVLGQETPPIFLHVCDMPYVCQMCSIVASAPYRQVVGHHIHGCHTTCVVLLHGEPQELACQHRIAAAVILQETPPIVLHVCYMQCICQMCNMCTPSLGDGSPHAWIPYSAPLAITR